VKDKLVEKPDGPMSIGTRFFLAGLICAVTAVAAIFVFDMTDGVPEWFVTIPIGIGLASFRGLVGRLVGMAFCLAVAMGTVWLFSVLVFGPIHSGPGGF
jgi:hypothetical protein